MSHPSFLEFESYYLVGIKGVAMAALAQCLHDAGKKLGGSDVAEDFVTKDQLAQLPITIDTSFDPTFIKNYDCVIYTSAHQGPDNPQVLAAVQLAKPALSHAEALAELFNVKHGIAVCGVGGKSTTSAMITWIMSALSLSLPTQPSYAIGVGAIPGLPATGAWSNVSEYFVAEADEYVTDPKAPSRGQEITPRFSFLKPFVTVCTNLRYDHPDVYRDFEHTKQVYRTFFNQIKPGGYLVINGDDEELVTLATEVAETKNITLLTYGENEGNTTTLLSYQASNGKTESLLKIDETRVELNLSIPGQFNAMNAAAAVTACYALGYEPDEAAAELINFKSTMRRSEFIGEKNGVKYYDDYAHHPNEVKHIIKAFKEWFVGQQLVIAFQSHTFSRTKQLFNEFIEAFAEADEVVMIDIFASAREAHDDSISSDLLCQAINKRYNTQKAKNVKTITALAKFCQSELKPGDVLLTVGAGDIYQVHQLITDTETKGLTALLI